MYLQAPKVFDASPGAQHPNAQGVRKNLKNFQAASEHRHRPKSAALLFATGISRESRGLGGDFVSLVQGATLINSR